MSRPVVLFACVRQVREEIRTRVEKLIALID